MSVEALEKAIKICGSQAALARAIDASPGAVWNWLCREKRAAVRYCTKIEEATGGKVTCYELRPDVFPNPEIKAEKPAITTLPP